MTAAFKAFRVFDEDGKTIGRVVDTTLDDLSAGEVVIKAAYSSVNYKDALAGTGAGKIIRRFPLISGIDVSGTVASSNRRQIPRRRRGARHRLRSGRDARRRVFSVRARARRLVSSRSIRPQPPRRHGDRYRRIHSGAFRRRDGTERAHTRRRSGHRHRATGGVGSLAVLVSRRARLFRDGTDRKDGEHEYLRSLGATDVVSRNGLEMGTRPLEKPLWAGAVDVVGGNILAWLTRTMMYGGCIASSGLTGGTDVHTTVLPFILRGIKLLGIDSVMCPSSRRQEVWRRPRRRPQAERTASRRSRNRSGPVAGRVRHAAEGRRARPLRGQVVMRGMV